MAMDMTTALTIKANVVGQSQITGLQTGLGKVTKQTNKAAGAMGRFKTAAGGALGAMRGLLPVIGAAGVAAFAKRNLDAADAMSKLSQRTGVAAPMLDKFRKVAELSDTSLQSLEKAFPALARGIDDAVIKGTGPAAEAFARLGVTLTDANGKVRETDQVMLDLADKFKAMPDGTEKAALASQIFGQRLGSELIPMLNSGGDAVRNMGTALTQDFADKAAAFNDRLEDMQEKLGNLAIKLTEALLPVIESLLPAIEGLINKFVGLPEPVQAAILAIGGIAAVALVFAPLITAITAIGPLLAGIGPAIGTLIGVLGGLAPVIAGIFTGPVGWAALLVGAGVALFTFRDQITEFLGGLIEPFVVAFAELGEVIKQPFTDAMEFITTTFVEPLQEKFTVFTEATVEAFAAISGSVQTAFEEAAGFVFDTFIDPVADAFKSLASKIGDAFNSVVGAIQGVMNKVVGAVKGGMEQAFGIVKNIVGGIMDAVSRAIQAIASIGSGGGGGGGGGNNGGPSGENMVTAAKGAYWSGGFTPFAKGGVVTGPTLGLVGEAGPEYIVPARKAVGFASNILSGVRGPGAIPRFAEGGFVAPSNANVNIQTGPVTQMNGQDFVTKSDMTSAVRSGVQQTLDLLRRDGTLRAGLAL